MSGTGLRSPRHTFSSSITYRQLHPIAAAPVRPGETIVGYRVQADTYLNQPVLLPWMPPIEYEIGLWAIPLGAYPDYFKDFMVADPEDSNFGTLAGSGGFVHTGVADQGPHWQTPLQYTNRPWAGELAVAGSVEPADIESTYAAWVSTGTYVVARNYYEMEIDTQTGGNPRRDDFQLYDNPPALGKLIRSPLGSMIGIGAPADAMTNTPVSFANSISQWAERLSLLTQTNRTYKEYLEGWGIDPRRVQSLPEPLMLSRRQLRSVDQSASIVQSRRIAGGAAQVSPKGLTVIADPSGGTDFVEAQGPYGMMSTHLDKTFARRWTAVEPTVLLLTHCWWYHAFPGGAAQDSQASHHMDMARMVQASHWGDPAGGMAEYDFLQATDLYRVNGVSKITDEDGTTGPFAMNMLNLFLNGGAFSNSPSFGVYPPWRVTDGQELSADTTNILVNSKGKLSFSVATDLVK